MKQRYSEGMFREVKQIKSVNAMKSVAGSHVSNTAKFRLLSRHSLQFTRDK